MQLQEQWVIQLVEGQLLQSFSIDPKEILVSWYMPNNPGKTSQGRRAQLFLIPSQKPRRCSSRFKPWS